MLNYIYQLDANLELAPAVGFSMDRLGLWELPVNSFVVGGFRPTKSACFCPLAWCFLSSFFFCLWTFLPRCVITTELIFFPLDDGRSLDMRDWISKAMPTKEPVVMFVAWSLLIIGTITINLFPDNSQCIKSDAGIEFCWLCQFSTTTFSLISFRVCSTCVILLHWYLS
ncbi:hypothetical protein K435DRAFT_515824 [Dendrothele bispora CBS 962.96]|uniref:Uncharacterized protein n=1 Tax=Dendrothele bispora (strain CBS 962.96) TaxID=1314807 RepID=A0A4S8KVI6_DENBC|nr:hypothetical protein K435DRAFT_515824 [Dendrothele bispora CBS 962.96]